MEEVECLDVENARLRRRLEMDNTKLGKQRICGSSGLMVYRWNGPKPDHGSLLFFGIDFILACRLGKA